MTDEELLQQSANCPTMYFDGFGAFRNINGVLRCIGYTIDGGAQLSLIVALNGAEAGIIEARRILDEKPVKSSSILERLRLPH